MTTDQNTAIKRNSLHVNTINVSISEIPDYNTMTLDEPKRKRLHVQATTCLLCKRLFGIIFLHLGFKSTLGCLFYEKLPMSLLLH